MKLNMDCIRASLLYLSEHLTIKTEILQKKLFDKIDLKSLYQADELEAFSDDDIFYSIYNLMSCKFIEATPHQGSGGPITYYIFNVTYQGHQFLESIREPTVWERTKSVVKSIGNHSLKFIEDTAQQVAIEMGKTLVIQACNGVMPQNVQ